MSKLLRVSALLAFAIAPVFVLPCYAQQADRNARLLSSYMQPYAVTKLEWQLLQLNISWAGSFTTPGSYLTSYPLFFDYKKARFHSVFTISEQRDIRDPDPWSKLSRVKRESILQGAVDQLIDLMSAGTFPEMKEHPELVLIEFRYSESGGSSVTAAKFENGALSLLE